MPEYIDRKRAISEAEYEFGRIGAKVISRVPISDVVSVIRCKDCVYRNWTPGQPNILCGQMKDDDFCSYGKMKF